MPVPTTTLRTALLAVALGVPFTAAISPPAHADTITRGCRSQIFLEGDGIANRLLVQLDARGTCEGRRNADRCRERAHDVLRACIDAVRDEWADHDIPTVCRPSSGLRTGMNHFIYQGVFANFPNGNTSIEDRITYESCCSGDGRLGRHDVTVRWSIIGNDGCSGDATNVPFFQDGIAYGELWRDIETGCTAAWDAGICTGPRPGGTRTNPSE